MIRRDPPQWFAPVSRESAFWCCSGCGRSHQNIYQLMLVCIVQKLLVQRDSKLCSFKNEFVRIALQKIQKLVRNDNFVWHFADERLIFVSFEHFVDVLIVHLNRVCGRGWGFWHLVDHAGDLFDLDCEIIKFKVTIRFKSLNPILPEYNLWAYMGGCEFENSVNFMITKFYLTYIFSKDLM